MKHLKWLLLLPILAFPYFPFMITFNLAPRIGVDHHWVTLGCAWLAGLIGALAILFARRLWTPQAMALTAMIVKLVQIPAYVLWFLFAMAAIPFGGPAIAFFFDALTIIISGTLGLAAVLRNHRAGRLTTFQSVGCGVLQFLFCVDIIGAIFVYYISRKHKEETV